MADPGKQVGAAHIKVSAAGASDAKAELESLRAEIKKLSGELQILKQAADAAAGTGAGGGIGGGGTAPSPGIDGGSGGGGGGGGLGGLGAKISTITKSLLGFSIAKQFIDVFSAIGMVNAELDKYAEKLTRIRGAASLATSETVVGIQENTARSLGIPGQAVRSPGPNVRALGGATSDAVRAAAEELQRARMAVENTDIDLINNPLRDGLSTLFTMRARRLGEFEVAKSNYEQTVRQESNQLVRNINIAREADALELVGQIRGLRSSMRR